MNLKPITEKIRSIENIHCIDQCMKKNTSGAVFDYLQLTLDYQLDLDLYYIINVNDLWNEIY